LAIKFFNLSSEFAEFVIYLLSAYSENPSSEKGTNTIVHKIDKLSFS
jgi:hypothetical protein